MVADVNFQFPYALEVLPQVLKTEWDDPQFAPYRSAFPEEYRSSKSLFEEHVRDLVKRDVKAPYLKSLQGYLWQNGYQAGKIKAPLFTDVAPKIEQWVKKDGLRVMIYSSGSVAAQKLLFKYTDADPDPDLTPLITDFFDTVNAGPKMEAASYETIAAKYKSYPAGEWLFLSDNIKEVEAATAAGMQSFVVHRPGNAPEGMQQVKFKVIQSFDELG